MAKKIRSMDTSEHVISPYLQHLLRKNGIVPRRLKQTVETESVECQTQLSLDSRLDSRVNRLAGEIEKLTETEKLKVLLLLNFK